LQFSHSPSSLRGRSTAGGPHAGDPAVVDRLGNLQDAIWVHVRVTAAFGIMLLAVVWYLRRSPVRRVAFLLLGVVIAQAIVGEVQWRNALPWWLVLIHVGLAAGIWAVALWLVALLRRPTASPTRA
jgi:heme A synthase